MAVADSSVPDECSAVARSTSAVEPLPIHDVRQLIQKSAHRPAALAKSSADEYFDASELAALESKVGEDIPDYGIASQGEASRFSELMPQLGLSEDSLESLSSGAQEEADQESLLPIRLPQFANADLQEVRRPGRHADLESLAFAELPDLDRDGDATRISLMQNAPAQDVREPSLGLKDVAEEGYDFSGEVEGVSNGMTNNGQSTGKETAADKQMYRPSSVNLAYEMQERDSTYHKVSRDSKCGNGEGQVKCSGPNKVLTFGYKMTLVQGIFLWLLIAVAMCCVAPVIRCVFETAAMAVCLLQLLCFLAFVALGLTVYFKMKDD